MPTSKELIKMANLEWKNREERKGIHDRSSWVSGWISGYLTNNPQVEQVGTDGLTDSEYEHTKLVQEIEILHERLQVGREKVLVGLLDKFRELNRKGNFRPWNIGHIEECINEELRKDGGGR